MGAIATPIDGLTITPLKIISDQRGAVMHMIRNDSPTFKNFGEIYFSAVNPNQTKGWKRHKIMTQNFAVPVGNMKFYFIDSREDSSTFNNRFEITIGVDNYALINVPPMIWYAFSSNGGSQAIIANCASIVHDPTESENLPLESFVI